MVYLIIGFGGFFAFFWALALFFASKTVGERSLGIPSFWIVIFGAIAAFGFAKYSEAQNSPEELIKSKYLSLQEGMNIENIQSTMVMSPVDMKGLDEEELKLYDLTSNRITMPGSITGRLAPGIFDAERQDSEVAIEIYPGIEDYEADAGASKRKERNKTLKEENGAMPVLGSSAIVDERSKQGHGLLDLTFRVFVQDDEATDALKEERKLEREENKEDEDFVQGPLQPIALKDENNNALEWFVTEVGNVEDQEPADNTQFWTYEDNMTAAEAAQSLATAFDAFPEFVGTYELDEDALVPNSNITVMPQYCLVDGEDDECTEENINGWSGDSGNKLKVQVMTGANEAVRVGRKLNGTSQNFFGGADEVELVFWQENEPFLDDDFNTQPRLIVAGLLRKKLIALGQSGLPMTRDEEPLLPDEES
jgi:hypothetical protein